MLDSIEAFCKAHEHTIAALEAFGTLLAVIVSLGLAHRATIADRTRLIANVQISTILHPSISPNPRFVVVSITNTGNRALQIPLGFFHWRVPFRRRKWVMLPIDSTGILGLPQRTYPFEIKPRSSETFYISEAAKFYQQMAGIRKEQNILGRSLFSFKKAIVSTGDGLTFRAKGDRGILFLARTQDV